MGGFGTPDSGGVAHAQPLENVPAVNAIETAPTEQGGAARAVAVLSGGDPLIVGTAKLAGLEVYDISGKRLGAVPAGEAVGVDVRYGALGEAPLIVAADAKAGACAFTGQLAAASGK